MDAIRRVTTHAANIFLANLHSLHPRICSLCGEPQAGRAFCHWCVQSLPGLDRVRCLSCAAPVSAPLSVSLGRCKHCRERAWAPDRSLTLADYAMPVDRLILSAKHHGQPQLMTSAAHTLAKKVRSKLPIPAWPDLVIPVPLNTARLRYRGFNQSALIARVLARQWQIQLSLDALIRLRNTQPQQSLARRERHRNLANAFACRSDLTGKRILLTDDVMTSGATIHWAAVALRAAGASSVTAVTLARTP
ncbi:MAG: ComF family protein [Burkholderiaceae bacterium]